MNLSSHFPRKRFGQNFLRDANVIAAILSAIDAQSTDHVVEIGPGQGALTRPLVEHCGHLDAVEIDRDLAAELRQRYAEQPRFTLHEADALRFPLCSLVQAGEKLRVVGNLPYNISTPLLFRLFEQQDCIADMHFMLQKEVVARLCAAPGTADYGRLSVMTQLHARPDWLFDVPPESFYPRPKVTSSVFRLTPHPIPPVELNNHADFERLVAQAFSQRRKILRNTLKGLLDAEQIAAAGVDPGARAETLGLEEFARLANWLA
ncbi:MAG TPA: 16S rRNA (adenine(1518)-N(6)/adenine(1519)-N(6))-dimethyltransferase RsmA [Methylococcaceae bacterium]|nr:16S rRNA (adenine(1518)-N(6)/adenine(1519)-N(6))-dimethyltransferase RsmA [Methylococcaceae bacterium]